MLLKTKKCKMTAEILQANRITGFILAMLLAIVTVFSGYSAEAAYAAESTIINESDITKAVAYCESNPVSLTVEGKVISTDVPPLIIKDRTLIPARAVFESLGATVTWNSAKKQVAISSDNSQITLTINSTKAIVDGQTQLLDVAPLIVGSRTMIPIRFVAESLHYDVAWAEQTRTVEINGAPKKRVPSKIWSPVTVPTPTKPSVPGTSTPTQPSVPGTTTPTQPSVPETATPTQPSVPETPANDPVAIVTGAYYVATNGNDSNSGTAAAPFRSIQRAVDMAKAGATVYIRGGTYNQEIVLKNSGTAGNVITITNYPGEKVIIDGTGFGYSSWGYSLMDVNGQDYININGLNIQNSIYWGIGSAAGFSDRSYTSGSNYVTVSNCTTNKTGSSGIIFHSGTGLIIEKNKISHSNSTGDQEALTLCTSSDFVIRGNEVTASDKVYGEGIDCKQGCKNGNIYDNYIHDMPNMGIYIDAAGLPTTNINIFNNTMTNVVDGVRLCNEWANSADFGHINVYNNTFNNTLRGLNIEQGEGNYPIHDIKYYGNTHNNVANVAVRCLIPSSLYSNFSFTY